MKQNNLFLIVLCLLFISTVSAQQVSGLVTDDTSEPLSGVSVIVKGTVTGAITDFDGKYSIEAANGAVLTFSYVGFDSGQFMICRRAVSQQSLQVICFLP